MIFGRKNRELREENAELRSALEKARARAEKTLEEFIQYHQNAGPIIDNEIAYAEALRTIADQETPGANATVRRMANIAREALGEKTQ